MQQIASTHQRRVWCSSVVVAMPEYPIRLLLPNTCDPHWSGGVATVLGGHGLSCASVVPACCVVMTLHSKARKLSRRWLKRTEAVSNRPTRPTIEAMVDHCLKLISESSIVSRSPAPRALST